MEMHNIECTGLDVDHINRKRDDNRIENLRAVTRSVNAHNQKLRITNKTGVMGVSYDPIRDRYRAGWSNIDGCFKQKYFSCREIGAKAAFEAACYYRAKKIRELNLGGGGYTQNHGSEIDDNQ